MKRLILAAIRCSLMLTALTAPLFYVQPAQAFTITLEQMGSNVVATGSGAINLTGLTFLTPGSASPGIEAIDARITMGDAPLDIYLGSLTGPTNFGTGNFVAGNPLGGDSVGIFASLGEINVPEGYVSGNPLSDSMTFDNATIHSLGLRPGTYTWTWGTGQANQFFTLIIPGTSVPDGGSTVSLLSCALLGLAALRGKLGC